MSEVIRRIIALGKKYEFTFDYDGEKIKLRPLTTMELDDAQYRSTENVDPRVARFILKMRLKLIGKKELNLDNVPEWMFREYTKYMNEYDYWVVYYAMKDFYEGLTIEDVRKLKYIHYIAADVLIASSPVSKREMIRFVETEDGKELGELVFRYRQPLAKISELTPGQELFLRTADPERKKSKIITKEELYEMFPELIEENE